MFTMIMRTTIITLTVVCCLAVSSSAQEPDNGSQEPTAENAAEPNVLQQITEWSEAANKINGTAVAARFIKDYVTPKICSYSPGLCVGNQIQSRGIQSYLATAGTLFAGVLGVMLTKIKILVILSLVTMITGKLLLLYAFHKTTDYHHHHPHSAYYHHSYKSHAPYVKYTKDKYYIKHTPSEHSNDYVSETGHSPYHRSQPSSSAVSYYRR